MKYLTQNKYWKLNIKYNIDKLLYLLIDRPAVISNYYCCWLTNKRDTHRNYDLPAVVYYRTGDVVWFENDFKLYDIKIE